jgi:hypothetical protein
MYQCIQNWFSKLSGSPKAINYKIFKTKFEFEEYLNVLEYKNAKTSSVYIDTLTSA